MCSSLFYSKSVTMATENFLRSQGPHDSNSRPQNCHRVPEFSRYIYTLIFAFAPFNGKLLAIKHWYMHNYVEKFKYEAVML